MSTGAEKIQARACVVGGGPAGMVLGFLLARAAVDVVVLEKHADFLRDFRGDTIHPSTLELLHELGLLASFLERPHQELRELRATVDGQGVTIADFSRLPTHSKFIAFMPQWDFLNFLAEHAKRYAEFRLRMQAEVTELVMDGDRVVGVRANTPAGELEVRAELVVGADGRHSVVRERAGLEVRDFGVPIDVLWMHIPKDPHTANQSAGYFHDGKLMVLIDREDYYQCGYIIPKGKFDEIRGRGLEAFRAGIVTMAPFLRDRVEALADWNEVKLLSVKIDRLNRWYRPGLLCIGDAAHAMSPAGGVGINLAVQDAVAAANILWQALRQGHVDVDLLRAVQRRRLWPTRAIQAIQTAIHKRMFGPQRSKRKSQSLPWQLRLVRRLPFLRRLVARVIGLGFRPEHVKTPDAHDP